MAQKKYKQFQKEFLESREGDLVRTMPKPDFSTVIAAIFALLLFVAVLALTDALAEITR